MVNGVHSNTSIAWANAFPPVSAGFACSFKVVVAIAYYAYGGIAIN